VTALPHRLVQTGDDDSRGRELHDPYACPIAQRPAIAMRRREASKGFFVCRRASWMLTAKRTSCVATFSSPGKLERGVGPGGSVHYLNGQPLNRVTVLEVALPEDRWLPVRYEWHGRPDEPVVAFFDLAGAAVQFVLPPEATVRWPQGDLDPPCPECGFGTPAPEAEPRG
jgi:hypothetical protein